MFLVGGGAVDGRGDVTRLAERVGAPVVMTINGKGTVPDDHPLCLGTTLALEQVIRELEDADVVLAVGTEFAEIDYYYTRCPNFRGHLVRVDIDPDELLWDGQASVTLCGDTRHTLRALDDALVESRNVSGTFGAERARDIRSRLSWWPDVELWRPILDALFDVVPRDTIVTTDSNTIAYLANHYAPAWTPRSWLAPAGFGTLGPSIPMAIGAKIGAPHRPVLAIVGDGGLLFTVQELGTAVDLRLPVVVLLWNNRGYGAIRDAMAAENISPVGTDVTARNFEHIALGLGCRFDRARSASELATAVRSALATREGPSLIELELEL
jgi:acetolactate synthase-1/2/3 large subunit